MLIASFLNRETISSRRKWDCSRCTTDWITPLNGGGGRANFSTYPFVIVFSTHGDTAHARQLATQPGRLCFELNLLGTNPLMVNESKPRSTPTPPREEDEIWGCPLMFLQKFEGGAIALCASRGESHKHAWALRHLGQELGHMIVVLVRTCLPCWTFPHVSDGLISVEAVWTPPLPAV